MFRWLLGLFAVLSSLCAFGQVGQGDWESYVLEVNQKPVSIVVDLALKSAAPMKERPVVIIIRTKLRKSLANGQPGLEERQQLDSLENRLEAQLQKTNGAVYAGRFTQRGLREYYFYALDSFQYLINVQKALAYFPDYQWLCRAKYDPNWSHYNEVLYPSGREYEIIQNRRQIDILRDKGDPLTSARRIDHYLYFKTRTSRDEFIRSIGGDGFAIAEMMENDSKQGYRFGVQLYREDVPDYSLINKRLLPIWENALKYQGVYDGWKTHVQK